MVALAQPRRTKSETKVSASGVDIVVAIDMSGSMQSEDFELNGEPANRLVMARAGRGYSVRERSGYRLLLDAGISLLRQWLLRSEYWSRPERPVFAGGLPSPGEIHRISDQLQKKANRVNLAWALSVIPLQLVVVAAVHPATRTAVAQGFYLILPTTTFLALYLVGISASKSRYALTSIAHSNHTAQTELKRKRDEIAKQPRSSADVTQPPFPSMHALHQPRRHRVDGAAADAQRLPGTLLDGDVGEDRHNVCSSEINFFNSFSIACIVVRGSPSAAARFGPAALSRKRRMVS